MYDYDIVIVGGGPAGSTLARIIGKKFKVLLLEKRSFETHQQACQKCCGGLIAPDAQKMLAVFGLGIPKSVILSPQLFSVRTIDLDNNIEKYYQRNYINIDREEFDKWLLTLVPSGVDIKKSSIYKSHQEANGLLRVKFHSGNNEHEVVTKLLVGADGAFSKVRNSSFPERPRPEQYISVQEWFDTSENLNCYGAIFDSEITDFYSWTIPKENQMLLGTALKPGSNVEEKLQLLKGKLAKYGYSFNKPVQKNGAYLLRPLHSSQICIGGGKTALAGEAAGFISPSSAEGLSYSFRSSLALANALTGGIEEWHRTYHRNTASLRRNIFIKNAKSPIMYNSLLRMLAMKSGILSINME